MKILILHGIEDVKRARRTSINHAFFLPKYAPQHQYVFQGVNDPVPTSISSGAFDAILIDTTFLCWRWAKPRGEGFDRVLDRFAFVARSEAVKIALPQDEYDHCAFLDEWMVDWKIDVVGMPCFDHRSVLLPRASAKARMQFAMTGYLDHADLALASGLDRPFGARSIDVGYRARHLPAFFGSLGRLKADVAPLFERAAAKKGLALDISTRESDRLTGNAWLGFLADCRFTLGTPSGSSVADPVGEIRSAVDAYTALHPEAGFDEIAGACFPGLDGIHEFSAVSPRIFEAALAGTCQILVEGRYLPELKPGEHYIELARDFGNIDEVMESLHDDEKNMRRIRATRELLVRDRTLSYRGLATEVLGWLADAFEQKGFAVDRNGLTATSDDNPAPRHDAVLAALRSGPARDGAAVTAPGPRACLLSMSRIPDDPRVRRQGDALFGKGWDVSAVGVPGARSIRPVWPSYDTDRLPPLQVGTATSAPPNADIPSTTVEAAPAQRLTTRLRKSLPAGLQPAAISLAERLLPLRHLIARQRYRAAYVARSVLAHLRPEQAEALYWSWASVNAIYRAASRVDADVWVANDWLMLPVAARLAREKGGYYVYDTHEFAVDEYRERLKWRIFQRHIVKALESRYIRDASAVSTVSEGIATALQKIYALPERPLVVRNTPHYSSPPGREAGPRIRVLYHGIIAPVRGLEPLIASVKYWEPEYELTIRGPVEESYRRTLDGLVAAHGVADRVALAPPVPMIDLVREAALFDIGFFAMPNLSQQHQYVLPNKLFEYIMAGLAVCVSDQPEMRQIVETHGVGLIMPGIDEKQIADAVNSLTPDRIKEFKARSRETAKILCWEHEAELLIAAWSADLPERV